MAISPEELLGHHQARIRVATLHWRVVARGVLAGGSTDMAVNNGGKAVEIITQQQPIGTLSREQSRSSTRRGNLGRLAGSKMRLLSTAGLLILCVLPCLGGAQPFVARQVPEETNVTATVPRSFIIEYAPVSVPSSCLQYSIYAPKC